MASKTTLNAKNLEALGAAKLAELALELAQGDAAAGASVTHTAEKRDVTTGTAACRSRTARPSRYARLAGAH